MAAIVGTYWVGQIPGNPLSIQVRDENNTPVDLSTYSVFKIIMLDSDNKEIQLESGLLNSGNALNGKFVFSFPKDRSLFNKQGDYLFQLEMSGPGKIDRTGPFTMRVKELGRKKGRALNVYDNRGY